MKKTLLTFLTVITLSVSGQTQSVVIIDVQQQIETIKANQRASGLLLLEAKQSRLEGLVYAVTFSALGAGVLSLSKGNNAVNFFGVGILTFGGTMSVIKLVQSFNYIGKAGRVLID